jgi:hypothetical protein
VRIEGGERKKKEKIDCEKPTIYFPNGRPSMKRTRKHFPTPPKNLDFDQQVTLYVPPAPCGNTRRCNAHTNYFLIIFKVGKLLNHLLSHAIITKEI